MRRKVLAGLTACAIMLNGLFAAHAVEPNMITSDYTDSGGTVSISYTWDSTARFQYSPAQSGEWDPDTHTYVDNGQAMTGSWTVSGSNVLQISNGGNSAANIELSWEPAAGYENIAMSFSESAFSLAPGALVDVTVNITGGVLTVEDIDVLMGQIRITAAGETGHEHDFTDEWQSDDVNHWKVCPTEGTIGEMAEHVYTGDSMICDVCGHDCSDVLIWTFSEVENGRVLLNGEEVPIGVPVIVHESDTLEVVPVTE